MNKSEHSGFNGSKLSFASAALRGEGRVRAGIAAAMLPFLLCGCGEAPHPESVGSDAESLIGTTSTQTITTTTGYGGIPGLVNHLTKPVTATAHGTSIDVEFEFYSATDVFVEVGTGPLPSGYLNYSGPTANLYAASKYSPTATHHLVHVTGLRPGTQYYVNVVGWKANVPAKTLYRMVQVSFDAVWDKWSEPAAQFVAVSRVAGTWGLLENEPYFVGCAPPDAWWGDDGCCHVPTMPNSFDPSIRYCYEACTYACTEVDLEETSFGVQTSGSTWTGHTSEMYPGNAYGVSQLGTFNSPTSNVIVVADDHIPLDVIAEAGQVVSSSGYTFCMDPRNYVVSAAAAAACDVAVQTTVNLDLRPKNGVETFVQAVPVQVVKAANADTKGYSLELHYTLSVSYAATTPRNALWVGPDGVQIRPGAGCQKQLISDTATWPGDNLGTRAEFSCPPGDVVGNPVSGP